MCISCKSFVNLDNSVVFDIMGNAPKKENNIMANINGINYNIMNNGMNLYTKRTCSDNSELFITSKLNMLYEQALSSKNLYNSRRNLRKMVEGNHLDETV